MVFALSTVLAGAWGKAYLHRGVDPMVHRSAFIVFVVLNEIMLLAPLLAFAGPLQEAKHLWQRRYGALGGSLVRRFDERWLDAPPRAGGRSPRAPRSVGARRLLHRLRCREGHEGRTIRSPCAGRGRGGGGAALIPLLLVVIRLPKLLGQLAKALL